MIDVAAAIIKSAKGEILICQRGAGGSTAFLWEFPGGKKENDEKLEECLVRECFEELGVEIQVSDTFGHARHKYPEAEIEFTFFDAEIISDILSPTVHTQVLWADVDSMGDYEFCPADIEIINQLISS